MSSALREGEDDPWATLRSTARNLLLATEGRGHLSGSGLGLSSLSIATLRRRKTWDLLPVPSGFQRSDSNPSSSSTMLGPCNWLLLVNKKSVFSISDAAAVVGMFDELGAWQFDSSSGGLVPLAHPEANQSLDETVARDVRMLRRPPRLLVVLEGGTRSDYRAVAMLRAAGLDVWPARRFRDFFQANDGSGVVAGRIDHTSGSGRTLAAAPLERPLGRPRGRLPSSPLSSSGLFRIHAPYVPCGDQPSAIADICQGIDAGRKFQTLMGATGTGKTFVMANVIEHAQRPTLVLAPNKVLAAQLFNELRAFFPAAAVEYFISFYDFYVPETYDASTERHVDKISQVNDAIDRMRHSATKSLVERRDCIVVASVSCM